MKTDFSKPTSDTPVVPHASEGGAQDGRETPKQRKARMLARIKAGAPARMVKPNDDIPAEVLEFERKSGISVPSHELGIPATDIEAAPPPEPVRPEPAAGVLKQRRRASRPSVPRERRIKSQITIAIAKVGEFRTPSYGVLDAGFGVIVLLPDSPGETVFIPEVGTVVEIRKNDGTDPVRCFYPGVSAPIPGTGMIAMAFVKSDDEDA